MFVELIWGVRPWGQVVAKVIKIICLVPFAEARASRHSMIFLAVEEKQILKTVLREAVGLCTALYLFAMHWLEVSVQDNRYMGASFYTTCIYNTLETAYGIIFKPGLIARIDSPSRQRILVSLPSLGTRSPD